jgi:hypothetical protein
MVKPVGYSAFLMQTAAYDIFDVTPEGAMLSVQPHTGGDTQGSLNQDKPKFGLSGLQKGRFTDSSGPSIAQNHRARDECRSSHPWSGVTRSTSLSQLLRG